MTLHLAGAGVPMITLFNAGFARWQYYLQQFILNHSKYAAMPNVLLCNESKTITFSKRVKHCLTSPFACLRNAQKKSGLLPFPEFHQKHIKSGSQVKDIATVAKEWIRNDERIESLRKEVLKCRDKIDNATGSTPGDFCKIIAKEMAKIMNGDGRNI